MRLEIQRAFVHSQCRFFGGLTQRGVGMADAGNVLAAGFELHSDHAFAYQLAGHRADDVYAQNFVRRGIGQHFDHACGVKSQAV